MIAEPDLNVLLVEDDDAHADLVELALETSGRRHTVNRAGCGAEAIARLLQRPPFESVAPPDVVLLDLNLPGVDGHEVLERIRATPVLCNLPVVVLTTSISQNDRSRATESRADGFLVKPVAQADFDDLMAWVARERTRRSSTGP